MSDYDDTPLTDPQAERATIGTILIGGTPTLTTVLDVVQPDDFTDPRHQAILSAAQRLAADGRPVDAETVRAALGLPNPQRDLYVLDCASSAPSPASASTYAERVQRLAQRRRVQAAGQRAMQLATNPTIDTTDMIARVHAELDRALGEQRQDTAGWVDVVNAGLDRGLNTQPANITFPTGLAELDHMLGGGYARGRLITVAARPGKGKSILLGMGALAAAKKDHPVLFASLELGREELGMRLIACDQGVDWRNLDPDAPRRAVRALERDLPIVVDDTRRVTVAHLRAALQRHKPALLVVDYLQLLTPTDSRLPRHEQVGAMTRELKILAGEHDVAVLLAAQLNRQGAQRADHRPQLTDLRESGSIEQDSDVVLFIHDPADGGDEGRSGEVELIVGKQRNGPTGSVAVAAQLHYSRFVSLVPQAWRPSDALDVA